MSDTTRRDFLKTTSAAAAGLTISGLPAYSAEKVRGANDRIRVAIVGAGDRMMSSLVPAFMQLADGMNYELVAVCDIWKHHRETNTAKIVADNKYTAKAKDIAQARNTDELYAMKNIDAVMIATADFQHAYHATEAIRAEAREYSFVLSNASEAVGSALTDHRKLLIEQEAEAQARKKRK